MFKNLRRKKDIATLVSEHNAQPNQLKRVLTVRDLTFLGIAAVVGAGIFSTIGSACHTGGPAVSLLFVFTAIASGFAALCYAEFASRIPVAGSAYTYAYASFGELVAWIIGWTLILEYAIGNITVALSWSSNLVNLLHNIGIDFPSFLTTSYIEAQKAHTQFVTLSVNSETIPQSIIDLSNIYLSAPKLGSIPFIINVPAFLGVLLVSVLVYIGIQETKRITNAMVLFKVGVILLVVVVGLFYVSPQNWSPFAPNGVSGVMKGVSAVFFAYIGFDAISTTSEECKNPQRDMPKGMIYALLICTVLYVAVTFVITGMVSYENISTTGDFLAEIFNDRGLNFFGGVLAFSAVVATTSVLLVFQLGQPRIWLSMSRDGLLPQRFSTIHPRFKTPSFATFITFLIVGIPSLFLDASLATDMNSIGTIFAFILVCGGVLLLPKKEKVAGVFSLPYINSGYNFPLFFMVCVGLLYTYNPTFVKQLFTFESWETTRGNIPYLVYFLLMIVLAVFSFLKKLSLIPLLGLTTCGYLMTEMGIVNWERFLVWMLVGLLVYFGYGYKKSKLNKD